MNQTAAKVLADAYYGKQNDQATDLTIIRMAIKLNTPNAAELVNAYFKTYGDDESKTIQSTWKPS